MATILGGSSPIRDPRREKPHLQESFAHPPPRVPQRTRAMRRKMIPTPFHTPLRGTIAKSRNHFPDDGTRLWGNGLRRFCHPRAQGSLNKRGHPADPASSVRVQIPSAHPAGKGVATILGISS